MIGGAPGALIRGLLARRLGKEYKDYYTHQIERGGVLLLVRCANPEKECLAVDIMKGHSGRDVHVHARSEAKPRVQEMKLLNGGVHPVPTPVASREPAEDLDAGRHGQRGKSLGGVSPFWGR